MNPLIKQLRHIPKSYFTIADIDKVSKLNRESLRVAIHRLVKNGDLVRISKGIYHFPERELNIEALACELGYPAYLSLEWALAHHAAILHQLPYTLELMTLGRSQSITLAGQMVKYHHLQRSLFWGYQKRDHILLAEPEKAILDLLYLERLGLKKLQRDEVRWKALDLQKLQRYAKKTKKKYLRAAVEAIIRGNQ